MKLMIVFGFIAILFANPPWNINVQVSQDPGNGNQNETTMAIFGDSLICGGWNDSRQGSYHVGFAASTDGGTTWHETLMVEPTYPSDCDPCILVDEFGVIYYIWLSYNPNTMVGDNFLTKSIDWGRTWGPSLNINPGTSSTLDDKPWGCIDGNNVFFTWYEYGGSNGLKFKRSTDYGATWSAGIVVGSGGNGTTPFRGQDSTVFVGWGAQDVRLNKSTNMGTTWQGQQTIIPAIWNPPSTPYRLNNIPCFKTSVNRSNSYVVFADSRLGSGQLDVFFSRSTNQGTNWSAPVKINDTPAGDTTLQFYPWMAVDPSDNIHVVWHDTRGHSRYYIGQYYAYSSDQGITWSANQRVSDTVAYTGTFIGDYTASAASAGYIYALWCDCRNGSSNPDVFFSKTQNLVSVKEDQIVTNPKIDFMLNFPNPFTRSSRIIYSPSDAELRFYQADGRRVKELNARGIYFVRLKKDGQSITRKLIMIE
ncbi:hypothetical protein A2Y85_04200 [candidate division WOR-3 bacterium RBG_13_43_14]|uniref:Secretion system C-terminal sorting domain-containing protein n=1 Tax=candidate division WOR-3 bacterium RBG_13_43_14 TaxID=1802590 RepID=A0A1F4UFC4_UNCW3|nr:MAG: hypothetical protein A2Y85_04200 [candidate division WOR-3 bacterium RBG_13_43_14]